jgi:nitrous oxidase accessory protein NosD
VTLDLQGFKIAGGSAGAATHATGISASNRKNITIKNGIVSGFLRGIFLEDTSGTSTSSQGHLVQAVRARENTLVGIQVQGRGNAVLDNQVARTGGTTVFGGNPDAYGIWTSGPDTRILNNEVTDTEPSGSGAGFGITAEQAAGTVIEKNRVSNAPGANGHGIEVVSGDDLLVIGNRISGSALGLVFGHATGRYRDNLISGAGTPYTGGEDAGNNQ